MRDFALSASNNNNRDTETSHHPKVRFALQGGGALGAYGAGVLQAFDEAGIQATVGSGLSAGALNLHTYMHAGSDGLNALWERLGRDGDKATTATAVTQFFPKSYLMSAFRLSGLPTPLDYLRSAITDSIDTHRLPNKKLQSLHISTVTKIDPRGDLSIGNVREIIHRSREGHNIDVILATAALEALTEMEAQRCVTIDGVPHWDGIYSQQNPNLSMFLRPSKLPLIVVSVDEPEIRTSFTDPHIQYGHIHQDVEHLRRLNKSPVYHVALRHREHWGKRVRTQPTRSLVQELLKIGRQDGQACTEQIKHDFAFGYPPKTTHDSAHALG